MSNSPRRCVPSLSFPLLLLTTCADRCHVLAATVLPLENVPGVVDYYAPPKVGLLAPDDCTCNTVVYSLLAACGLCQGQGWTSYAFFLLLFHIASAHSSALPFVQMDTMGGQLSDGVHRKVMFQSVFLFFFSVLTQGT
jgi:hypothetical protein